MSAAGEAGEWFVKALDGVAGRAGSGRSRQGMFRSGRYVGVRWYSVRQVSAGGARLGWFGHGRVRLGVAGKAGPLAVGLGLAGAA